MAQFYYSGLLPSRHLPTSSKCMRGRSLQGNRALRQNLLMGRLTDDSLQNAHRVGHNRTQVNCLTFVPFSITNEPTLISGDSEGRVIVWRGKKGDKHNRRTSQGSTDSCSTSGSQFDEEDFDELIYGHEVNLETTRRVNNIDQSNQMKSTSYPVHHSTINSLCINKFTAELLTASDDKTLGLIDLNCPDNLQPIRVFSGHSSFVTDCCYSEGAAGQIYASSSLDSSIRLWHKSVPDPVFIMRIGKRQRAYSVRFVPGDKFLLLTSSSDGVHLWDIRKHNSYLSVIMTGGDDDEDCNNNNNNNNNNNQMQPQPQPPLYPAAATAPTTPYRTPGRRPNNNGMQQVFGATPRVLKTPRTPRTATPAHNNNNNNNSSLFFDISSNNLDDSFDDYYCEYCYHDSNNNNNNNDLNNSNLNDSILNRSSASIQRESVWLSDGWSSASSVQLRRSSFSGAAAWGRTTLPNNAPSSVDDEMMKPVLTIRDENRDHTYKFDKFTKQYRRPFVGHEESNELHVYHAQFSHDGHYVLTSSDDNTHKLWDFSAQKGLFTYDGAHLAQTHCRPCLTSDDRTIICGSQNGTLCFWNTFSGAEATQGAKKHQTGNFFKSLKVHMHPIQAVCLSESDLMLASCDTSGVVNLISAQSFDNATSTTTSTSTTTDNELSSYNYSSYYYY